MAELERKTDIVVVDLHTRRIWVRVSLRVCACAVSRRLLIPEREHMEPVADAGSSDGDGRKTREGVASAAPPCAGVEAEPRRSPRATKTAARH